MSHNKALLLVGGPADGQRLIVSANARTHNTCEHGLPDNDDTISPSLPGKVNVYAIQAVQSASHEVFSIGVMDLSLCIQHALVAGYRKPKAHHTDMNVAAQMVTLLGGDSDGHQAAVSDHHDRYMRVSFGDQYRIISLSCKDGTKIRVGVLDKNVDPLPILIAGYRFGVSKSFRDHYAPGAFVE